MSFNLSARSIRGIALGFAGGIALSVSSFQAMADSKVSVELNKLDTVEGNCRATLVVRNSVDQAFDELRLDLVVFDKDSVVAKRLIVDVAPLAAQKRSVKTFDIGGIECERISDLLLNDVPSCGADDCLDLVDTASRSPAATFTK